MWWFGNSVAGQVFSFVNFGDGGVAVFVEGVFAEGVADGVSERRSYIARVAGYRAEGWRRDAFVVGGCVAIETAPG